MEATQVEVSNPPEQPPSLGWSSPSGRGIGLGADLFGSPTGLAMDLSIVVPLGGVFALRMRPTLFYATDAGGAGIGDKLELVVRSAVLMNFVRVYAGGGPAVFYGLSGPTARQVDGNWFHGDIDGNWFAGTEIFLGPRAAMHSELGTSGGALGSGAGPYIDAGLTFYP
jgi:hypothetical protein